MIRIRIEAEESRLEVKEPVKDEEFKMREELNYISKYDDYEKLKNLPSLNGEVIKGEMNEIDPTVPDWAKQENKPEYSPEELNAININDAISLDYLASLFA